MDLTQSRVVDFSHVLRSREAAERFVQLCNAAGFRDIDTLCRDDDLQDVTVSVQLLPTCENITRAEVELGHHVMQAGGYSDGWGFLGD